MNIKRLTDYRNVWMGVAMLLIISFHPDISFGNTTLNTLRTFGYGGVDIFLLAAGFGNYFSYFKDENPLNFIKRKIYRLMPTYIPFIAVWCLYQVLINDEDPYYIIGNLLGIQGLSSSGFYFNWYLTVLVICYILTPYFASYIKNTNLIKNALLVIILVLASTAFWRDDTLIISFTRLPIFVIGMIFAKYSDVQLDKKYYILSSFFCIVGIIILRIFYIYKPNHLWGFGFYWYPFILITPFICTIISLIAMCLEKTPILNYLVTLTKKIGTLSFELYLVHIFVFDIVKIQLKESSYTSSNLLWFAITIIVFILALLLNVISKLIRRILKICIGHV